MAASKRDAIDLYRNLVHTAVALGKGDIDKGIEMLVSGVKGIPPMPSYYGEGIKRRYMAEGEVI
jgi:hypothetical protein